MPAKGSGWPAIILSGNAWRSGCFWIPLRCQNGVCFTHKRFISCVTGSRLTEPGRRAEGVACRWMLTRLAVGGRKRHWDRFVLSRVRFATRYSQAKCGQMPQHTKRSLDDTPIPRRYPDGLQPSFTGNHHCAGVLHAYSDELRRQPARAQLGRGE